MFVMRSHLKLKLFLVAVLLAQTSPLFSQEAAKVADIPPDPVISMRQHWLDADINAFNFRNSEQIFETRTVPRAGAVWRMPRAAGFNPPSYQFEGKSRSYSDFAARTYTNAFLVIRDGKIMFEDYRNRTTEQDRFISFSMAKSITSLLVGIALDKGQIKSLDDTAGTYVPELKGGGYGSVSIRQLLQMRSGVDYEERYDFGEKPSVAALIHMNAIVLNKERFADRAKGIGTKTAPGSRFNYATLDTAVLGWILERATGTTIAAYTAANLWGPTGMEADGFWIADGPPGIGRELNGMGYNARLRDFGRLGLLMLNDGKRGKVRVLPEGWMKQATTMLPFPADNPFGMRGGYGFQIWQLDNEPGAFVALGLAGQFIYVHPSTKTVIVKLSHFPNPEPANVMPETLAYFKAITSR
jgi:CubicO group peptidase (beta-lactamase class C family)